jgi:uncharacterized membrane protein
MATLAEAVTVKRARLESVDLLRGVIMIIMALDHTRDYFGQPGSPTNLATTSAALFFTRWITNFCAPVFFLLLGTGAFLSLRKRTKRELSRFLFTRGVWLIFLELTFFRCLAVQFNFDYHVTIINVLWALGWAMIVLSALVYLPAWSVTTHFPITQPPGWGLALPLVYLIWAIVVVTMYPLCRWYASLKQRSSNPWLSYI